ncbi:MAG: gfo/Idh/MocA family oxidoreductase [Phycisphaerales bacterium]|nr:MAG: gfo/Idh/MocA family oxidoreductase [Phycisphaerales bacterium]
MSSQIRVNVIGAGRWGPNLIRAFFNLRDVTVGVVCDRDPACLDRVQHRFRQIEITADPGRAIDDRRADAVVVATPVHTHYELAKAALQAGRHVLVEKPLCGSVGECRELESMADGRGRVLAVGHVFLFNPGIRKIKQIIDSGELGRIYYIYATRTNLGPIRDDVNACWDLASHDLSIFQYWLGGGPESVTAQGASFLNRDVHDVTVASYLYPGGVLAAVHASWLNPRKVREITIVGDRKMAVWDDMAVTEPVRLYDKSVEPSRETVYADTLGAFQTIIREGDVLIPKVSGGEPLAQECAHFIECIRTGQRPLNNAAMGTDVVRALEATDESLRRRGATVDIESAMETLIAGPATWQPREVPRRALDPQPAYAAAAPQGVGE